MNIDTFDDGTQRPIEAAYDTPFMKWTMAFQNPEPYECLMPMYAPQTM